MCGLRLVVLFVFVNVIGGVVAIAAVYPVTWFAAGMLLMLYYFASHCIEKSAFDNGNEPSGENVGEHDAALADDGERA